MAAGRDERFCTGDERQRLVGKPGNWRLLAGHKKGGWRPHAATRLDYSQAVKYAFVASRNTFRSRLRPRPRGLRTRRSRRRRSRLL